MPKQGEKKGEYSGSFSANIGTHNKYLSAVKVYARMAAKAEVIDTQELQLIKAVSGYGRVGAKRIDARRPLVRVGDKKETPLRLTAEQARLLKNRPNTPMRPHCRQ